MNQDELINAGERALESLKLAREEIGKAVGWGVVDILGGGFIVSMIKRNKINNTKQYITQAKTDVQLFADELKESADFNLEMGMILNIGDFVESLVADIWIQAKLSKAKKQLDESIVKLQKIVEDLRLH